MDCLIYFAISLVTTLTRLTLASPPCQAARLLSCKSQSLVRVSPTLDLAHFSPLCRFHATWWAHIKSYFSLTAARRIPGPPQPVSNCASHPVIFLITAGPANTVEVGRESCSLLFLSVILLILEINCRIRGKIGSHLHGNILRGVKWKGAAHFFYVLLLTHEKLLLLMFWKPWMCYSCWDCMFTLLQAV